VSRSVLTYAAGLSGFREGKIDLTALAFYFLARLIRKPLRTFRDVL
jgi:hypothetical protein